MSEDESSIGGLYRYKACCGQLNYENSVSSKLNMLLKHPLFVMGILYILFYISVTLYLTFFKAEMTNTETLLCQLGFVFFILSIWIAFIEGAKMKFNGTKFGQKKLALYARR